MFDIPPLAPPLKKEGKREKEGGLIETREEGIKKNSSYRLQMKDTAAVGELVFIGKSDLEKIVCIYFMMTLTALLPILMTATLPAWRLVKILASLCWITAEPTCWPVTL